ncbi:MAG: carbohydrate porin [Oligoflexia bacterium]|nr:carbohydrate porin [Oligoflexia bacterium]
MADDQLAKSPAHLLGNWGGAREQLEEHGLTIESILTADLISNVAGGISKKTGKLLNYDLSATLDAGKAGGPEGGTLFVYLLGDAGSDPSAFIGDLQVSDNIEAPDTFKLYELWYDQAVLDGAVSVLVGLHDYNSEFAALDYAGTLINSSFGVENEIAQSGPSIFPTTSLAARLYIAPTSNSFLRTAIYDGVPGDPSNPRGTHVKLHRSDGLFWATEAGWQRTEESPYKLALGGWTVSTDFEGFDGHRYSSNGGLYSIGERKVYSEEDSEQGLGLFYQAGFARADRNQTANYFGCGAAYTGVFEGREVDVLTLGVARAGISRKYRDFNADSARAETVTELAYRIQVLPYWAVQPDLQYIHYPGALRAAEHALVLGIRTEFSL